MIHFVLQSSVPLQNKMADIFALYGLKTGLKALKFDWEVSLNEVDLFDTIYRKTALKLQVTYTSSMNF